jgi:hypothetical protein
MFKFLFKSAGQIKFQKKHLHGHLSKMGAHFNGIVCVEISYSLFKTYAFIGNTKEERLTQFRILSFGKQPFLSAVDFWAEFLRQ